jgi:uncharacterized protein (DUF433 family)
MTTYSKAEIGIGIYTIPDISRILCLRQQKLHFWIKEFWEGRMSLETNHHYVWGEGRERGTNFYALIEFYTFFQLRTLGVSAKKVLEAHRVVAEEYKTPYPFALSTILTDGRKVFYSSDGENIIHADRTRQMTISKIMREFCKKVEFGKDELARRFWPFGKRSSIVIDPSHQFGQPVINNTNILAEVIYRLHKGGESPAFVSRLYKVSIKEVRESIKFFGRAA